MVDTGHDDDDQSEHLSYSEPVLHLRRPVYVRAVHPRQETFRGNANVKLVPLN